MNLFQMSLSGGVLILFVTLIRTLLVNRFPKRFFLFLWSICLVRLLIPFYFSSDLSVYSLLGRQETVQDVIAETPLANLLPQAASEISLSPGVTSGVSGSPGLSAEVLGLLWLIGFLFFAIFFGVCYMTCLGNYKTSLPVSTDFTKKWLREHSLQRKISIRQSDLVTSPLTYGFFRPVILLPKSVDLNNEEQLEFIFLHEYFHIRRFDSFAKLLMIVTLSLHWFNPLVWIMYLFFNRDLELTCDEAVVRFVGTDVRANYARTLVSMEEQRSVPTLLFNSFSKNTIEERIIAIMKPKKITLFGGITAVALILCIGTCFLTSAKAAESDAGGTTPSSDMASESPAVSAEETPDTDNTTSTDTYNTASVGTGIDTNIGTESALIVLMTWPTESNQISSSFGTRTHPLSGVELSHDHIDIAGDKGDDVYAALDGTITEVSFDYDRGNYIVLTAADGTLLIYGQLLETLVSEGDEVTAGTIIGSLGATGKATGPHLSFGVFVDDMAVDPMNYFK